MPDAGHKDRSQFALTKRKALDRSIVLVVVGMALILPPLGAVALMEGTFAGLPIPLVYLFAVWALLIACAGFLARPLADESKRGESPPRPPDGGS